MRSVGRNQPMQLFHTICNFLPSLLFDLRVGFFPFGVSFFCTLFGFHENFERWCFILYACLRGYTQYSDLYKRYCISLLHQPITWWCLVMGGQRWALSNRRGDPKSTAFYTARRYIIFGLSDYHLNSFWDSLVSHSVFPQFKSGQSWRIPIDYMVSYLFKSAYFYNIWAFFIESHTYILLEA